MVARDTIKNSKGRTKQNEKKLQTLTKKDNSTVITKGKGGGKGRRGSWGRISGDGRRLMN